MTWVEWVWLGVPTAIVLIVAIAYLGLPLVIWPTLRFDLRQIEEIELPELEEEDNPRSLAAMRAAFEELGFVEVVCCSCQFVSNVDSTFAMFVAPDGRQLGMAAVVAPVPNEAVPNPTPNHYAEFSVEYTDGRELNTNNSSDLPSADTLYPELHFNLPDIDDVSRLWRIHQTAVELNRRRADLRRVPLDRPPLAFFIEEMQRQFDKKIQRGIYYADRNGVMRLTLRGAYRLTWGELPPMKWFRRAAARRRSEHVRREADRLA